MNTNQPNSVSGEFDEIEHLLDALSAQERAAVSPGFEARIAAATQPGLRLVHGPTAGPAAQSANRPHVLSHRRLPLRIAAALALTGALLATIVATRSTSSNSGLLLATNVRSAELERDVDQLLSVYAAFEGSVGTDLDLLGEDLSTLGAKVRSNTTNSDWVEESL